MVDRAEMVLKMGRLIGARKVDMAMEDTEAAVEGMVLIKGEGEGGHLRAIFGRGEKNRPR